jgi:ribosomal protein S12 methylthiotransferase accessory factor YcaO
LELISKADADLRPYYPVVMHPASIVIDMLEVSTETDLNVRDNREAGEWNVEYVSDKKHQIIVKVMRFFVCE